MPTYQYVCTNPEDKHEFEVVHSVTDGSLNDCTTSNSCLSSGLVQSYW